MDDSSQHTIAIASRSKKKKNFIPDKEKQLCRSFLHVSQDATVGNGQRNVTFWDKIACHYNSNLSVGCSGRPARSLESKSGEIKHDVNKFVRNYNQVSALQESGTNAEDTLQKTLKVYKLKNPKKKAFQFIHCWLLLKEIPRWAENKDISVSKQSTPSTAMLKRRSFGSDDDEVAIPEGELVEVSMFKRPRGAKHAKEMQKQEKQKECALRVQARAAVDMAAATMRRAIAIEDQSDLVFFSHPQQRDSEEAIEYFRIRRQLAVQKMRKRLEGNFILNPTVEDTVADVIQSPASEVPGEKTTMNILATETELDGETHSRIPGVGFTQMLVRDEFEEL